MVVFLLFAAMVIGVYTLTKERPVLWRAGAITLGGIVLITLAALGIGAATTDGANAIFLAMGTAFWATVVYPVAALIAYLRHRPAKPASSRKPQQSRPA